MDSSASINQGDKNNYQRIKDFIAGFVKSVVIGHNDTRIGLATFSSENSFRVHFNFSEYSATKELVNAVQGIPYDAGGTYMGAALTRIRTDIFSMAREGIPKILIILTDGKSQDKVSVPSKSLRDEGVHIISVGVGNAVYSELADMASEPDDENIYKATFDSLSNIFGTLQETVCKGNWIFRINTWVRLLFSGKGNLQKRFFASEHVRFLSLFLGHRITFSPFLLDFL